MVCYGTEATQQRIQSAHPIKENLAPATASPPTPTTSTLSIALGSDEMNEMERAVLPSTGLASLI
jgi:hypothetical protein